MATSQGWRLETAQAEVDAARGAQDSADWLSATTAPHQCRAAITSAFECSRNLGVHFGARPGVDTSGESLRFPTHACATDRDLLLLDGRLTTRMFTLQRVRCVAECRGQTLFGELRYRADLGWRRAARGEFGGTSTLSRVPLTHGLPSRISGSETIRPTMLPMDVRTRRVSHIATRVCIGFSFSTSATTMASSRPLCKRQDLRCRRALDHPISSRTLTTPTRSAVATPPRGTR